MMDTINDKTRGGTSETTSNLLKHIKTHKNLGKQLVTVSNSGLLNKARVTKPNPVASRTTSNHVVIASTSKRTLHYI